MIHPKKIKIGPFIFTVSFTDAAVRKAAAGSEEPVHGLTSFGDQLIAIAPALLAVEREVLLHETLHGICAVSGLKDRLKGTQEEDVVSTLSPYLLDILRENKTVTQFLLED